MVNIQTVGVVARPVNVVFEYAADHRNMTEWVFGITDVNVVGPVEYGLGAIYEGAVDLGPKTLSSKASVEAWEQDKFMGLKSVSGFDFSLTLQLEAEHAEQTRLQFDLTFGTSGGATSRALSRTLEPIIALAAKLTTDKLCRAVLRATPSGVEPALADESTQGERP